MTSGLIAARTALEPVLIPNVAAAVADESLSVARTVIFDRSFPTSDLKAVKVIPVSLDDAYVTPDPWMVGRPVNDHLTPLTEVIAASDIVKDA